MCESNARAGALLYLIIHTHRRFHMIVISFTTLSSREKQKGPSFRCVFLERQKTRSATVFVFFSVPDSALLQAMACRILGALSVLWITFAKEQEL